jgi:hypothetical protein
VEIGFLRQAQDNRETAKRKRNLAKHGLDLADAGAVLEGRCLERIDDRRDFGEERWISIGMLGGQIVVCIWVERGEAARIISLRKADKDEQEDYLKTFFR